VIRLLKAILSWFGECRRLRAENARRERELLAAAQAPGAPAELVDAATIYFRQSAKNVKEANNGSGKAGRAGVA